MKKGVLIGLFLCALSVSANAFGVSLQSAPGMALESGFLNPPVQARPMVYWDWASGNISRAGITRDLEHMKRAGMGGGLLFDVPPLHGSYAASPDPGSVAFMSDEWLELVNFAAEESHRLGLDFGVVLCAAWNTGGPWIKPKDNNQLTAASLLRVSGPQTGPVVLQSPSADPDYKDIAVLAWPTPANESHLMTENPPQIKVNGAAGNGRLLQPMMDGNRQTPATFPAPKSDAPTIIEFVFSEPVTVDRFYIQEAPGFGIKTGYLEADVNGTVRKLADFETDGLTAVDVEFGAVTAKSFRIVATAAQVHAMTRNTMRLYEVALMEPGKWASSAPAILNLSLKRAANSALGRKRGELLLPDDHLEPTPDNSRVPALFPGAVSNLTGRLDTAGRLVWDVPAGAWTILRFGMVPAQSHTYNSEGRQGNEGALESDKMSAEASRLHYESMARAILGRLSPEGRKGLSFFHLDSWEGETRLWTAKFAEEFKKFRGYDPVPYLPVLEGMLVGNAATSDRFLWDYRRMIGDLDIRNHFKALDDLCHADGIKLSAQAGHGFQVNMDAVGSISQVDYPAGEFWYRGRGSVISDIRNSVKDAASAVNVYGKSNGLFEAFTTGQFASFWPAPYDMKKLGDYALAEGVSRMCIHGLWHDPVVDNAPPGIVWSAGISVGPSITWMPDGRAFFDYLSRCQYLLQAGAAAKDVLYFYGDGMPNITPKREELWLALPEGRDYDATDSRAIRELISMKDGKLTLPHGATYRALVLPPIDTMQPETLEAIHRLVMNGAVVIGPKPLSSPSLSGQPQADGKLRQLANELWGENPGAFGSKQTGKGYVHWGSELAGVFAAHNIPPQVEIRSAAGAEIKHLYRHTPDGREIYFLSNQSSGPVNLDILFRSSGKHPYLWQPDCGEIIRLKDAVEENGRSRVAVQLAPCGSTFVVFDPEQGGKPAAGSKPQRSEGAVVETAALTGSWEVAFETNRGAPERVTFDTLKSWTGDDRPGIKYFSGYGTYTKPVQIDPSMLADNRRVMLDLGQVGDVAHVKVNGRDFGTLWKPPYTVDITAAVRAGENRFEIAVVNTWVNRLIGDDQLPPENAIANIMIRKTIPAADLAKYPSGLLGPVVLNVTDPSATGSPVLSSGSVTNYYDDFSGPASAGLDGTAPDVCPGSETWISKAEYKADGSFSRTVANGRASLPLTIEAGKTYKLSAEVTVNSAGAGVNWAGLGFCDSSAGSPLTAGAATLILTHSGAIKGYHDGATGACSVSGGGDTETLVLILTTYADSTPWKVDYYQGDKLLAGYTFSAAPKITQVVIGTGGASAISGRFENFRCETVLRTDSKP